MFFFYDFSRHLPHNPERNRGGVMLPHRTRHRLSTRVECRLFMQLALLATLYFYWHTDLLVGDSFSFLSLYLSRRLADGTALL